MKGKQLLAIVLAGILTAASIPLGIGASMDGIEASWEEAPFADAAGEDLEMGDFSENLQAAAGEESLFTGEGDPPWQEEMEDPLAAFEGGGEPSQGQGEGLDLEEAPPLFGDELEEMVGEVASTPTPLPSELVQVIVNNNLEEEVVAFSSASISDALLQAKAKDMTDIGLRLNGDLVVDVPIVIDGELMVNLECGKDVTLKRGATCTGALFTLSNGCEVTLSGGYVNEESHTLTIDGAGKESTGPIFDLKGGASLSLIDGVRVQNASSSGKASVLLLEKDGGTLSLMGTTISGSVSSHAEGSALLIEEGYQGEIFLGGDGAVVYIAGNKDASGAEANITLEKAGEDAALLTLLGDLPEGSKVGVKAKNEAHNVRVVKPNLDGIFENEYADSLKLIEYNGSSAYSISTEDEVEGYLTDGKTPLVTPTPLPLPTFTGTPVASSTPTPTITMTPKVRVPYIPPVNSAADGYKVLGLEKALEFPADSNNTFDVTGASAEIKYWGSLVAGDGKWSPYYWTMDGQSKQNNLPSSNQMNNVFTTRTYNVLSRNGIYNTSASYKINLYFKLFIWAGNGWVGTDIVQYAQSSFTVAKITPTPVQGIRSPYVPMVNSGSDGYRVRGLESPLEFPYGANNTFDVTGASAENLYGGALVVGDGKWSPYCWVMDGGSKQNNLPASDQLNNVFTTRTFNIKSMNGVYNTSASYKINLYFRLFTWAGSGWAVTDVFRYVQTTFTVANITPTPGGALTATPTPTNTPSNEETVTPTMAPSETVVSLARPGKPKAKTVDGGVRLTWKKVKKAKGYDVYREEALVGSGGALTWGSPKWLGTASSTTFDDRGAEHLGRYRYSVAAASYKKGKVTYQSSGLSEPRTHVFLKKPGTLTLTVKNRKVTAVVQEQSGVDGYILSYQPASSSLKVETKKFTGGKVTTKKLKKGTWYFYYKSYLSMDGTRYSSVYSDKVKIKVK